MNQNLELLARVPLAVARRDGQSNGRCSATTIFATTIASLHGDGNGHGSSSILIMLLPRPSTIPPDQHQEPASGLTARRGATTIAATTGSAETGSAVRKLPTGAARRATVARQGDAVESAPGSRAQAFSQGSTAQGTPNHVTTSTCGHAGASCPAVAPSSFRRDAARRSCSCVNACPVRALARPPARSATSRRPRACSRRRRPWRPSPALRTGAQPMKLSKQQIIWHHGSCLGPARAPAGCLLGRLSNLNASVPGRHHGPQLNPGTSSKLSITPLGRLATASWTTIPFTPRPTSLRGLTLTT